MAPFMQGAVPFLLLASLGLPQRTWAQADPTRQWFVCYGPQKMGRLPPPPTVYVSDVSTATNVTGETNVRAAEAFRAFVKKTYGLDFDPRCDWLSSEAQAMGVRKSFAGASGSKVIATGWVWKPTAADTARRQALPRAPGSLPQ